MDAGDMSFIPGMMIGWYHRLNGHEFEQAFLLFKPHSLWFYVVAVQADEYRFGDLKLECCCNKHVEVTLEVGGGRKWRNLGTC